MGQPGHGRPGARQHLRAHRVGLHLGLRHLAHGIHHLPTEGSGRQHRERHAGARQGELALAERHFRAALARESSSAAQTGLGVVLRQTGRMEEAVATLRAAVESDPGNAAAYDQLGTTLVQMGKLPGAAETYRALVHARPSPAAHRELANVLDRLGQTEEAQRERGTAEALERADVGRPMP